MHSQAVIICILALDVKVTREACKRRLQEATTICSVRANSQLDPHLPHINSQLDNMLLKVKASTSATHTTISDSLPVRPH